MYRFHPMETADYEFLRRQSSALFKAALPVPVACAVFEAAEVGESFTARVIREKLGGRLESNQIREALQRLEVIGAVKELPYPGKPHPRVWERLDSAFWPFLVSWIGERGGKLTGRTTLS